MRTHLAIFTAASLAVAGMSIGCGSSNSVPEPDVYGSAPPTPLNDPVRVTGQTSPAQRMAAEQQARDANSVGSLRMSNDGSGTGGAGGTGATGAGATGAGATGAGATGAGATGTGATGAAGTGTGAAGTTDAARGTI